MAFDESYTATITSRVRLPKGKISEYTNILDVKSLCLAIRELDIENKKLHYENKILSIPNPKSPFR